MGAVASQGKAPFDFKHFETEAEDESCGIFEGGDLLEKGEKQTIEDGGGGARELRGVDEIGEFTGGIEMAQPLSEF